MAWGHNFHIYGNQFSQIALPQGFILLSAGWDIGHSSLPYLMPWQLLSLNGTLESSNIVGLCWYMFGDKLNKPNWIKRYAV